MNKKIIIKKSKDGKYYINYQSGNGEIISTTEMLDSIAACKTNILAHMSFFETKEHKDDFIKMNTHNKTVEYISWLDI